MKDDLHHLTLQPGVAAWRLALARRVESRPVQTVIIGVIVFNAVILGLETDVFLMERHGDWLVVLDRACLVVFIVEIALKLVAYGRGFWRSGWNVFDFRGRCRGARPRGRAV